MLMVNTWNKIFLTLVCCVMTTSAFSESLNVKEGEDFFSARIKIISNGWKPLKTFSRFEDGELENEFGEAMTYKQIQLQEERLLFKSDNSGNV